MNTSKRRKVSEDAVEKEAIVDQQDDADVDADRSRDGGSSPEPESDDDDDSNSDSLDTEDDIVEAKRRVKSKKTQKRKRRATSPTQFGAALQSLLNTDAPSNAPLSLKPSVAKKYDDRKLEAKAKKVIEGEKKEKEEKNHIKDVIGGWGGDGERTLRKVAQRGVVKLFNAIQMSQSAAAAAQEDSKSSRGTGKPTLPAPSIESNAKRKKQKKDQLGSGGRGKENRIFLTAAVAQADFIDIIRAGGIVSKA